MPAASPSSNLWLWTPIKSHCIYFYSVSAGQDKHLLIFESNCANNLSRWIQEEDHEGGASWESDAEPMIPAFQAP